MIPEIYMERDRQNFFSFWTIFFPFTPPPSPLNNPKNQNFEKQMKKTPRDIIILHKCTIHDNHKTDRFFCHLGTFFALLSLLPFLEISSFYTSVPKIMIIGYTVPEIWHVTHAIVIFHSRLFFALLPL